MKVSKTGYKKNSKDKNQPSLLIPSNNITMKGVEFPVLGTDNLGNQQMMYPGIDYQFPGNYVHEIPIKEQGGIVPGRYKNPEGNWVTKYAGGGPIKPKDIVRVSRPNSSFKIGFTKNPNVYYIQYTGSEEWDRWAGQEAINFKKANPSYFVEPKPAAKPAPAPQPKPQAPVQQAKPAAKPSRYNDPLFYTQEETPVQDNTRVITAPLQGQIKQAQNIAKVAEQTKTTPAQVIKKQDEAYKAAQKQKEEELQRIKENERKLNEEAIKRLDSDKVDFVTPIVEQYQELVSGLDRFLGSYVEEEDPESIVPEAKVEEEIKPEDNTHYGYKELYTVPDSNHPSDSLVSFTNTFDNLAGARYYVGHKANEVTSGNAPGKFENARAVAHFLRDSDILPNQKIAPKSWSVGGKSYDMTSTSPGKALSGTGYNDPERYRMAYKPNQDGSYTVKYIKTKDITPEFSSEYEVDLPVSGQHRFSDIDWEGEGKKTGFAAWAKKTRYLPLKEGVTPITSWPDKTATRIPYKDKDSFSRFSGGSIVYMFTDPKTGKQIGMDVSGSVNTMKKIGEKIINQYGIKPEDLELVYHDMGSYSAKPKAHGTTLDYNQWLDYNQYNKGFSGAPLVIPVKKYGGPMYQVGGQEKNKPLSTTYDPEFGTMLPEVEITGSKPQWAKDQEFTQRLFQNDPWRYDGPITSVPFFEGAFMAPVAMSTLGSGLAAAAPYLNAPLTIGSTTIPGASISNLLGLKAGMAGANMLSSDISTGYYNSDAPTFDKFTRGLETGLNILSSPGMGNFLSSVAPSPAIGAGPLMAAFPRFNREVKNIEYFQKMLDSYSTNRLSHSSKKYYQGIIDSVKKQGNMASDKQYDMLQRLIKGDFDYGRKAYGGPAKPLKKYQTTGEVIFVDNPDDPRYTDYQTRMNLWRYSQVPNFYHRAHMDLNDILKGNLNLTPDYKQELINLGYNYNYDPLNTDQFGNWGSTNTYQNFNSQGQLRSYLRNQGYGTWDPMAGAWDWSTFNENSSAWDQSDIAQIRQTKNILRNYPPDYYVGQEEWESYPYRDWFAYNGLPDYHPRHRYLPPNTAFIEDKINREALRKIYPNLPDSAIDEYVAQTRDNPTYQTNVRNPLDLRYTDAGSAKMQDNQAAFTPVNGLFPTSQRLDYTYNKREPLYYPRGFNNPMGYLQEHIDEDPDQYFKYLPGWNKPTQTVMYRMKPKEGKFSFQGNLNPYKPKSDPDREIIQVHDTPDSRVRSWSKAVQKAHPGLGTHEYADSVRIGNDIYPVTHKNRLPYGEFEIDGKKQYIKYRKNEPETGGGYTPIISETKPEEPKPRVVKFEGTFKKGGWLTKYQGDTKGSQVNKPLTITQDPEFGTMLPEVEIVGEKPFVMRPPLPSGAITSVPFFEGALMAPVALGTLNTLMGANILGSGITAANIANPYFMYHGAKQVLDPRSDFRRSLSDYTSGQETDWRPLAGESLLTGLNFLGARSVPGDISAIAKSKPASRLAQYVSRPFSPKALPVPKPQPKSLSDITSDIDALNADLVSGKIPNANEATNEDMQALLERLQGINRSLEQHIDPAEKNAIDDLLNDMDMNYDPSITDNLDDIDPDIYRALKDRAKNIEEDIAATEDAKLNQLANDVPEEFAAQARALPAKAKPVEYYTDAEIKANIEQYNKYMDAQRRYREGYDSPFLPEELEKEFELLFPDVKLPEWNKEFTPEQFNKLMTQSPALYRQFFGSATNKLSPQNLKYHGEDLTTGYLWNSKLNSITSAQQRYDDLLKESANPNAWFRSDPKGYLEEMLSSYEHELSMQGINTKNINLEKLSQEKLLSLAEKVNQSMIKNFDWMRKNVPDLYKSWETQPKGSLQIPFRPEQWNKYGGGLDKYQVGNQVNKQLTFTHDPELGTLLSPVQIVEKKPLTLEQRVNMWLGEPMKRASEEAEKRAMRELLETGEASDPGDSFRHSNAGRLTREAIQNKFPGFMQYTGIPQLAGFLGSTALGIGHEVTEPNRSQGYSWWDTAREAGEDIINNTIGASGLFSEEDLYNMYLNNQLPDGYGKGNMYFKHKKGGVKSSAEGYYDYINGYSGIFAKRGANSGKNNWLKKYQ